MEEAGVSGAEGPHDEGPDDVTLAKRRTCMEAKHPSTAASGDLEHEEPLSGVTTPCTDLPDEDMAKEDLSAANTAGASGGQSLHHGRQSPVPSVTSMKSDQSMDRLIEFTGERNMASVLYEPYLMEAEDPDDITLAKQRTCMEGKHPGTAASRDLEHEETHSGITIPCKDLPDEDMYKEDLSAANTAGASGGQSLHHGRQSPVQSVTSMKSDQSMDRLIEFTEERNMASPLTTAPWAVLCDVCPKTAFKSCLTCMASFCEVHVKPHYTAPTLQRHKLVEAIEDLEERKCQRHNRELELYCNTDQTAICALCGVKEHRGHDVTDLEEHQRMRKSVSNMTTAIPPPGPIEFTSVKPDSVCVCWGPPEGLTAPHTFRVTWTAEGKLEKLLVQGQKLHVQELSPGEKYTFTVATLMEDGRESQRVAATTYTDVPPPEDVAVKVDLPSASVSWSKPAGVNQASYKLTLSTDGECIDTFSVKSLQHSIAELLIGGEYTITVSTVLNGRQSQPVSRPIRTSIPAPENVRVGSVTPTSADLSWSLQQGMQQIPHRFLISYCSEGTEPQIVSTESCSTTLTGLQPDTQYMIGVCCELIEEDRKSDVTSAIAQTDIFGPQGLSVVALEVNPQLTEQNGIKRTELKESSVKDLSNWDATLRWSLPGADQKFHRFVVSYNGIPQPIETNTCEVVLNNLQPDAEYTVEVSAVYKSGRRKSSSVTFQTRERRILRVGQTVHGKSSTGNTILGEDVFKVSASQHSVTSDCEAHSKIFNGIKYTVIDTPGFSDTNKTEEELKRDFAKGIAECCTGIHAVVIVMRVGRYTEQERKIPELVKKTFSENVYKHSMVLFTCGSELKGQTIEQFVEEKREDQASMETLQDLVDKCQGGCHVIDNENWKSQDEGECSNRSRLAQLFSTVEEMVQKNGTYTNECLLAVQEAIEQAQSSGGSWSDAKRKVIERLIKIFRKALFPIQCIYSLAVFYGSGCMLRLLALLGTIG